MDEKEKNGNLIEAFKEIQTIKFIYVDTFEDITNAFYSVMRKHGIKRSTPIYDDKGKQKGTTSDTPEWTICQLEFLKQLEYETIMAIFMECPEDLQT